MATVWGFPEDDWAVEPPLMNAFEAGRVSAGLPFPIDTLMLGSGDGAAVAEVARMSRDAQTVKLAREGLLSRFDRLRRLGSLIALVRSEHDLFSELWSGLASSPGSSDPLLISVAFLSDPEFRAHALAYVSKTIASNNPRQPPGVSGAVELLFVKKGRLLHPRWSLPGTVFYEVESGNPYEPSGGELCLLGINTFLKGLTDAGLLATTVVQPERFQP